MEASPPAAPLGEIALSSIARHLPADPVVVEAGAHVGVHTVQLAELWPAARIHAFEPVPSIYAQLRERVAALPNVSTYPFALADADGRAVIHVSSGASDASSSLLAPKEHLALHPDVPFDEEVEIETRTLASWAGEHAIPKVDFLWLDMQGGEPIALAAAGPVLDGVTAIYTEVNIVETYAGVMLYPEYRRWLEDRGFRVVEEAIPWPGGGNVLFVRERAARPVAVPAPVPAPEPGPEPAHEPFELSERVWPPPPSLKRAHLLSLFRQRGHRVLIESGTYLGGTVEHFIPHAERIVSVEIDPALHVRAAEHFAPFPHVEIVLGDAAEHVPRIVSRLDLPPLVYLDGHYSGAGTGRGEEFEPAATIVGRIAAAGVPPGTTIVVDDLRIFGRDAEAPTLEQLLAAVGASFPHARVRADVDALIVLL